MRIETVPASRTEALGTGGRNLAQQGLLVAAVGILAVANLWSSQDPAAIVPRFIGIVCLVLVLGLVALRTGPWLLALIVVGQTFVKGGLASLGGATRDAPASLPLIALGSVLGLIFLARASLRRASSPRFPVAAHRSARDVLIAALALGVVLFLDLPRSPLLDYGASKVSGYVIFNLVPMILAVAFLRRLADVRQLIVAFTVLGSLSALASIAFLWFTTGNLLGWGGLQKFDHTDFFGLSVYGGVWLGRRVGLAALSAIAAIFLLRTGRGAWLAAPVVAFDLFAVFLTGRGPFLALTAGILVFLLMIARRLRFYQIRGVPLLPLTGLTLVVGAFIIGALPSLGGVAAAYDVSHWNQEQDVYRANFYASAWDVFLSNPVAGVGTGGWRAYYAGPDQVQKNLYPHNVALELAAETGLIGLVLFVIIIGSAARASLLLYRRSATDSYGTICAAWAVALLVTSVINAMISGDIFRNDLLWVSAGVAAALGGIQRPSSSQLSRG